MNKISLRSCVYAVLIILCFAAAGCAAPQLTVESVKNTYITPYTPDKGYPNLGNAFDWYFERPTWTQKSGGVVFEGIAMFNGRKARFKINILAVTRTEKGDFIFQSIYVNDKPAYLYALDHVRGSELTRNMFGLERNLIDLSNFFAEIFLNYPTDTYDDNDISGGTPKVDTAINDVWEYFERTRTKWKEAAKIDGETELGLYHISTFYLNGCVLQYFDFNSSNDPGNDPRIARVKIRDVQDIVPGLRVGMSRQDVMECFGTEPDINERRIMQYYGMVGESGDDPSCIIFIIENERVEEIEFIVDFYAQYASIAEALYVYPAAPDAGSSESLSQMPPSDAAVSNTTIGADNMTVIGVIIGCGMLIIIVILVAVVIVLRKKQKDISPAPKSEASPSSDSRPAASEKADGPAPNRPNFCGKCGAPIEYGSNFCSSCGSKVR